MIIQGKNISMTRGDSESITVTYKKDKEYVDFVTGDIVYFTVKETIYSEAIKLQKIVTEFVEGKAIIELAPEDTRVLDFRTYIYDIQVTGADGKVLTLIKPSNFTIDGEVTRE